MLNAFGVVLILFTLCTSFDIIPISDYQKIEIKFNRTNKYYIFEYNNNKKSGIGVTFTKNDNEKNISIYIYLNIIDINEKFSNYYKMFDFNDFNYTIFTDENLTKIFYVVIFYPYKDEKEISFMMFSSNSVYYITNSKILFLYFSENSINITYSFKYPTSYNNKYLNFGFLSNYDYVSPHIITILENNNIIYQEQEEKKSPNIGFVTFNNNYSYKFNLKLSSKGQYFYIALSDYLYSIPLEMNPLEFKTFSHFYHLNFSLDISRINNKHRFKVEYEYIYTVFITTILYYSEDDNKNEYSKEIELEKKDIIGNERTYKRYFYVIKDNSDLKGVVLRMRTVNYGGDFSIRYGDQEFYYGNNVFLSIMIGLGLSLPNILFQIIRKLAKQRTAPFYFLFNDILLHFSLANLLSYSLHFGGEYSLIIGFISGGIFLIYFFALVCNSCDNPTKLICNQLYNSCTDFEELPIFEEFIKQIKKIPPKIIIKVNAKHKESREVIKEFKPFQKDVFRNDYHIDALGHLSAMERYDHTTINVRNIDNDYSEWKRVDEGGGKIEGNPGDSFNSFVKEVEERDIETWNKESEYIYNSWNDCSKNLIPNYKFSIINVSFDFKLIFSPSAERDKQKLIDELCKEGKTHDTDVYYREKYFCEGMKFKQRCYLNKEEYLRLKRIKSCLLFFIGFILLFTGYSSILNCFTYFEEGDETFIIKKLISGEDNLGTKYMENDKISKVDEYSEFGLGKIFSEGESINLGVEEKRNKKESLITEYDGSKMTKFLLYE